MTFHIHKNEKGDGIIHVQAWNDMIWLNCLPSTILTVPWDMGQYSHYLQIKMTFLVVLESVWVEEWFATRGTTNPTAKCTMHTCVQIVACEVDGPSLQPSTWHLYTLLMLPNWIWRGCMLVGRASSEAGEVAREAASNTCSIICVTDSEASGVTPVGSWGGGWETVPDGVWWAFLGGGGAEDMGYVL